jgi:hypothetical protein
MTRRDLALVALAALTVVAYTAVLVVVIVVARGDLTRAITAVVAALTPLLVLGGAAVGRLSGGPPQTAAEEPR